MNQTNIDYRKKEATSNANEKRTKINVMMAKGRRKRSGIESFLKMMTAAKQKEAIIIVSVELSKFSK